jgi:hypothetical protein
MKSKRFPYSGEPCHVENNIDWIIFKRKNSVDYLTLTVMSICCPDLPALTTFEQKQPFQKANADEIRTNKIFLPDNESSAFVPEPHR